MPSVKIATIAALSVQLAITAIADEIETHDAHEHGVALLNVVIEAGLIELEFDSPAISVIGFEHAPRTDAQKAAASRAQRTLQNAERLFLLSGDAECRVTSAEVTAPTWADSESHADYEARYAFQCVKPLLLRSIEVALINELAQQTRLRVQIVADGTQTSAELTRDHSLLRIR